MTMNRNAQGKAAELLWENTREQQIKSKKRSGKWFAVGNEVNARYLAYNQWDGQILGCNQQGMLPCARPNPSTKPQLPGDLVMQ